MTSPVGAPDDVAADPAGPDPAGPRVPGVMALEAGVEPGPVDGPTVAEEARTGVLVDGAPDDGTADEAAVCREPADEPDVPQALRAISRSSAVDFPTRVRNSAPSPGRAGDAFMARDPRAGASHQR